MEDITVVGLMILVFGAAIREIFGWFKQKNLQNSEARLQAVEEAVKSSQAEIVKIREDLLEPMRLKLDTLYEWHDKSDQDGVKVWYVRKSLENTLTDTAAAMNILAKNSEIQTKLLEEINNEQRAFRSEQIAFTKLVDTLINKNNLGS